MNKQPFSARIVTLDEIYATSYKLARQIMDANEGFDAVVAIARGGFPIARFMCDFLNIHSLGSLQITHYLPGAQKIAKTHVVAPVNIAVAGKKILLVDDVNDSGETLQAAKDYLQSLHPALLKTAVLHEKPGSVFVVDFVAEKIAEWKWLIYQWAVTEDILAFLHEDELLSADTETIQAHLAKKYGLQIDKPWIDAILALKKNY